MKLTAHGPTERQLHKSVAQMLDWLLLPPAFYTTFPAGWGWLPKATAGALYACGLKRGMPDVLLFNVGRVVGVELKVGIAKPTSDQRNMHAKLWAVGIRVYVCRSLEDVIGVLELEGMPMHQHWQQGVKHGKAASDQGAARSGAEESTQSARPTSEEVEWRRNESGLR